MLKYQGVCGTTHESLESLNEEPGLTHNYVLILLNYLGRNWTGAVALTLFGTE